MRGPGDGRTRERRGRARRHEGVRRLQGFTGHVLERAIGLRLLGLKTPDAIHIATGMLEGCDVFLTRDKDWARAGVTVVDPAEIA